MKRTPAESGPNRRDRLTGIPRRISSAEPRESKCKPRRTGVRFNLTQINIQAAHPRIDWKRRFE